MRPDRRLFDPDADTDPDTDPDTEGHPGPDANRYRLCQPREIRESQQKIPLEHVKIASMTKTGGLPTNHDVFLRR